MKTTFGILLIICTIMYSIRVVSWVWVVLSKGRRETLFAQTKVSPKVFYWGGLEHLFYMVSLIGSAVLLL